MCVCNKLEYILDAVGLSGISKGKQKIGVTFYFDKQGVIDFTKFSKMTQEGARHCRKPLGRS